MAKLTGMSSNLSPAEALRIVDEYSEICSYRPSAERLAQLSAAYWVLGDSPTAFEIGLKAIEMDPTLAPAILNVGIVLKDLGRYDEAYVYIAKAYSLMPDMDYIVLAQAEALLKQGKWTEAWPVYEHSFRPTKEGAPIQARLPLSVKEWDGIEIPEELLVLSEGGAGDRINFSRWLPELTKREINWKFHIHGPLVGFFERLPWMEGHLVKEKEKFVPDCSPSHWTTSMSLPANLRATPETIPQFPSPWIPDLKLKADFAIKSEDASGKHIPVIGLCWHAGELGQGGRRVRSLREGQAMRLISKTDHKVAWANLNYDFDLPWPVNNVPAAQSWEQMAALMSNLDGIISVDSGPLHLASAMGLETLCLLSGNEVWFFPKGSDWGAFGPTVTLLHNNEFGIDNAINEAINLIRCGDFPKKKVSLVTAEEFKQFSGKL